MSVIIPGAPRRPSRIRPVRRCGVTGITAVRAGLGAAVRAPDDLLQLEDFSDGDLLHALWSRYEQREIYTWVGSVLVSVNPYQNIGVFDDDLAEQYASDNPPQAPHLYATVIASLKAEGNQHAILITGESGSGKTEATRGILQFLALRNTSTEDQIRDRLLRSTPTLEAFGNAHTRQNTNSSRFGKFIEVFLSSDCRVVGATLRPYMLETSRVAGHLPEGERTYHVFYLLRAAVVASSDGALPCGVLWSRLARNQDWRGLVDHCGELLRNSVRLAAGPPAEECLAWFHSLVEGLLGSGTSLGEVLEVLRATAAASLLAEDSVAIAAASSGGGAVAAAAVLLGLDVAVLRDFLLKAEISVGVGRKEKVYRERSENEAVTMRATVAQELYSALFGWLTKRVVQGISPPRGVHTSRRLGLLDLYGFEVFAVNGFEQLLINYCNERLQQLFNRQVFACEAQEYAAEGLDGDGHWHHVSGACHLPALSLFEGGRASGISAGTSGGNSLGIFSIINDRSRCGFGNTDAKQSDGSALVESITAACAKHPAFCRAGKESKLQFGVRHFAGEVFYEAAQFVKKNASADRPDIAAFFCSAGSAFAQEIFAANRLEGGSEKQSPSPTILTQPGSELVTPASSVPRRKLFGRTLISAFQLELNDLSSTLEDRQCRHVRCLKPNGEQAPLVFDDESVLRQCRYSGLSEAARIRRQGFAHRRHIAGFASRYALLLKSRDARCTAWAATASGTAESCAAVCQAAVSRGVPIGDIRIGHTKVFMGTNAFKAMEEALGQVAFEIISAAMAGFATRRRYRSVRCSALCLQAAARGFFARQLAWALRAEQRRLYLEHLAAIAQAEAEARMEAAALVIQNWWRQRLVHFRWVQWHSLVAEEVEAHARSWRDECFAASDDQPAHSSYILRGFDLDRQSWGSSVSEPSDGMSSAAVASSALLAACGETHTLSTIPPPGSDRGDAASFGSSHGQQVELSSEMQPKAFGKHQCYQQLCDRLLANRRVLSGLLSPDRQVLLEDLDFAAELLSRCGGRVPEEHAAFVRQTVRQLEVVLHHVSNDDLVVTTSCRESVQPTAIVVTAAEHSGLVFHNNHPRLQHPASPSIPRLRPQVLQKSASAVWARAPGPTHSWAPVLGDRRQAQPAAGSLRIVPPPLSATIRVGAPAYSYTTSMAFSPARPSQYTPGCTMSWQPPVAGVVANSVATPPMASIRKLAEPTRTALHTVPTPCRRAIVAAVVCTGVHQPLQAASPQLAAPGAAVAQRHWAHALSSATMQRNFGR